MSCNSLYDVLACNPAETITAVLSVGVVPDLPQTTDRGLNIESIGAKDKLPI